MTTTEPDDAEVRPRATSAAPGTRDRAWGALAGATIAVSVKHLVVIVLVVLLGGGWAIAAMRARAPRLLAADGATVPVTASRGSGSATPPGDTLSATASGTAARVPRSHVPQPQAPRPVRRVVPAVIVIDVVGRVRRPGVVRLAPGARIADAITAAGGALPGTDLSRLNLAQPLVDGQQVPVGINRPVTVSPIGGRVASTPASVAVPSAVATSAPSTIGSAQSSSPGFAATAGPVVNLNTATLEELQTLPGVGPKTAQRILDHRTQHGRFATVDSLTDVSGIGEKTMAKLRPRVRV